MPDRDRKTITIDAELHADLETLKRDGESWTALLARLSDVIDPHLIAAPQDAVR